jgi:hypothetical protein
LLGLLLYPWTARLKHPSIVLDDVIRIENLRTQSLTSRLVTPFNEHLAPAFEAVTTLTWWLAGSKLEYAPAAMTVVSYVPFLGCLVVLWSLVRRELDSAAGAWIAVALFAATPIYAECVYWNAASGFTWALLFSLAGLWFAGAARADESSRKINLAAAAVCAFLAPASLAIGVLGGPLAALYGITKRRRLRDSLRANLFAAVPLLGTAAYLIFACLFKHEIVVARSLTANGHFLDGLAMTALAPAYLVLTGYLGVWGLEGDNARWLLALGSLLCAVFVLPRIWRATAHRRWIGISLILILAGYGLPYCVRVRLVGLDRLLGNHRYHLFPCAGLVMLVTASFADRLRRLDSRPMAGLATAVLMGLGLLILNRPLIRESPLYVSPHRDQRAVMKALDRLATVAKAVGVSRAQLIDALDPIEPRWCDPGGNILRMLPETAPKPLPGHNSQETRALILSGLSPSDQAALLGCTNLTARLVANAGDADRARNSATIVNRLRLEPLDQLGHYLSLGWPNFLEFSLPSEVGPAAAVALHGLSRSQTWELWWSTDSAGWSRSQVVVLAPSHRPETTGDWILPLDRIPRQDPGQIRRIRLGVRAPGPIAIKDVSLLR